MCNACKFLESGYTNILNCFTLMEYIEKCGCSCVFRFFNIFVNLLLFECSIRLTLYQGTIFLLSYRCYNSFVNHRSQSRLPRSQIRLHRSQIYLSRSQVTDLYAQVTHYWFVCSGQICVLKVHIMELYELVTSYRIAGTKHTHLTFVCLGHRSQNCVNCHKL